MKKLKNIKNLEERISEDIMNFEEVSKLEYKKEKFFNKLYEKKNVINI